MWQVSVYPKVCIGSPFRVRCKAFGNELSKNRIECLDIQIVRTNTRLAQSSLLTRARLVVRNLPAGAILNPDPGWTLFQHSFGRFPEPNQ